MRSDVQTEKSRKYHKIIKKIEKQKQEKLKKKTFLVKPQEKLYFHFHLFLSYFFYLLSLFYSHYLLHITDIFWFYFYEDNIEIPLK